MALTYTERILSRNKMLAFLSGLEEYPGQDSETLYLIPRTPRYKIEKYLQAMTFPPDTVPPPSDIIEKSPTGAAIFGNSEHKYLILPPFPVAQTLLARELATENLQSLLMRDYLIGLVLVRLGAYAVGVCRGETLLTSKVGTGNIHARHKKGGSSAHRFERHRGKQIEYFFTRVCQHAREHLEPQARSLDYLVYGGASTTILELQKQCGFLGKLDVLTLPSLLDIREPRQAVLESAVRRVWSSTIYEWQEAD